VKGKNRVNICFSYKNIKKGFKEETKTIAKRSVYKKALKECTLIPDTLKE